MTTIRPGLRQADAATYNIWPELGRAGEKLRDKAAAGPDAINVHAGKEIGRIYGTGTGVDA